MTGKVPSVQIENGEWQPVAPLCVLATDVKDVVLVVFPGDEQVEMDVSELSEMVLQA